MVCSTSNCFMPIICFKILTNDSGMLQMTAFANFIFNLVIIMPCTRVCFDLVLSST